MYSTKLFAKYCLNLTNKILQIFCNCMINKDIFSPLFYLLLLLENITKNQNRSIFCSIAEKDYNVNTGNKKSKAN